MVARLTILEYPDERLRTRAKPVTRFDPALQTRIDDMFETMYAAPGIGLAATQVDDHRQLIVIDVSETRDQPLVLINPQVLERSGVTQCDEGCLSVPGVSVRVDRAEKITVAALDRSGEAYTLQADGLLAICIQHEMDHLAGKVFVDYLSPLKRQLVTRRLARRKREAARSAESA